METNPPENLYKMENKSKENSIPEKDDASKLWEQYQLQQNKKKWGTCILFSFVIVIIVILVFVGLYIVLSTSDPLSSL
ncbi:hypothetical protein [Silvanigrella aquatica]|uniref:Uncharacterized protein n=1 Tax=Silvanigrella aquatica TaxID=1915309 RepID=A0A1L4D1Z8_9BACT|nr:hypothetical protein [Silvanigrella aquatica]APJ04229.1 hypothetical protein AXG55_10050 [Silvanigrella aquatica]